MKNFETGKFTNCSVKQPDVKNFHLPTGYSIPSSNIGVNWLGNNPYQPNSAIGYGKKSTLYLGPGYSYNASSSSNATLYN